MRGWIAVGLLCVSLVASSEPAAPKLAASPQYSQTEPKQGRLIAIGAFAPPQTISDCATCKEDQTHKGEPGTTAEERIADWTVWIVVLTGVLAVSTILLWLATLRLATDGKESSEIELRAYVGPDDRRVFGLTGGPFKAVIQLKNYGQTPAYNLHAFARGFEWEVPTPEEAFRPAKAAEVSSFGVLQPGEVVSFPITSTEGVIPELPLEKIRSGERAIYFYGSLVYSDAFNNFTSRNSQKMKSVRRETKFRFRVNSDFPLGACDDGSHLLGVCEYGNDAT